MENEDFLTAYLQGRYDEKKLWKTLIKEKIDKITKQPKATDRNYVEDLYVISVLEKLLEGEV